MGEGEKFTEAEAKELEKALNDAFTTYTEGREQVEFDASDIFPEQLWPSKVRTTNLMLEAYREMQSDYPDEPKDSLFIEAIEDHEFEDAPKWWESNPFNFNYNLLRKYFSKKFKIHCERTKTLDDKLFKHLKEHPEEFPEDFEWNVVGNLYLEASIFSKKWFELKIYELFLAIEDSSTDAYPSWKKMHYGELGRMIEHYRWKFAYQEDVLVGQKNIAARKAAENAKPVKAAERKLQILKCIEQLWHKAKKDLGKQAMRRDSNASVAIYAIAEKERPVELLSKSTGKLKSPETIRRYLPELRDLGKID